MRFSKILLASLISIATATAVQAQEQLTPQQVTALFFKTLLQTNPEAMKALNAYQQPVRDANGDKGAFINIEKMLESDAIYAEHLSKTVMKQVELDDHQKAALQPDAVAWFEAVRIAQKRTTCTFGEARPATEGAPPKGYKMITVDYDCKAVNPKQKVKVVLQRALREKWNSLEQYRQGFSAATQDYLSAPLTQEFSGKFPLTSEESVTIWQNTFPRETLDISDMLY